MYKQLNRNLFANKMIILHFPPLILLEFKKSYF